MAYVEKSTIHDIQEILNNKNKFVIVTHTNPDGDALGSLLAFYHFLKLKGKEVNAITPTPYPKFLHWLPGHSEVLKFKKEEKEIRHSILNAEVVILLDLNDPKRAGRLWPLIEENKNLTRILIDHHPDPVDFCDLIISDIRPGSTAELLYFIFKELDGSLLMNRDIRSALYTGIMTDTGCFSFNSSRPETFRAVSDLLETGIDKDGIYDQVYNNYSVQRMNLLGYSLNKKMKIIESYHTAYIALTAQEMKDYNFQIGDSEGFVNFPLSITGIRFSALFLEKDRHIKISFRSKGSFPANEFSEAHFNGGGHKNAAGGEAFSTLEEALLQFEKLLPQYAEKLSSDE